jgi:flagellar biosynthesis/type III secretory pathway ATPase
LATEEKVMNAFKNLNLDATTFDKNKKKCDNFKFNFKDYENKFNLGNFDDNEDDKDFSGILLSDELKNTLKQSKENSDYELLRKLSNKELVI